MFQFTLPHGERLVVLDDEGVGNKVSIHAPAWGATVRAEARGAAVDVSIHAPAWGATRAALRAVTCGVFQFTLPRGERPCASWRMLTGQSVSIHAPAWGATALQGSPLPDPRRFKSRSRVGSDRRPRGRVTTGAGFNSRSRVGSDPPARETPAKRRQFQFTLPRGERRRRRGRPGRRSRRFNSRSRVGSDRAQVATITYDQVSIHAPAWGATYKGRYRGRLSRSFNSRSRMGSDLVMASLSWALPVSIHAPAWGATASPQAPPRQGGVSIHAPAWGATARHGA